MGRGMAVKLKKTMQKDRSGTNTILVIGIVLVAVFAAYIAYVVMSDYKEEETAAPGTTMSYDVSITGWEIGIGTGTFECSFIGQNAKEYFIKMVMKLEMEDRQIDSTTYGLSSKAVPDDAKKTGTVEMETFDEPKIKTLDIWEYTVDGTAVKAYVDPTLGISYREELAMPGYLEVRILTAYDLKTQTSYKESGSIGKTYKYGFTYSTYKWNIDMVCVADCANGQYGVMYDINDFNGFKRYFLCDGPRGLPVEAVYNGTNRTLTDTADGEVVTQVFKLTDATGEEWTFYYEPDSDTVYGISVGRSEMAAIFKLTDRPK